MFLETQNLQVARRQAAEARVQELEAIACWVTGWIPPPSHESGERVGAGLGPSVDQSTKALVSRLQSRVAALEGRPPPKGWRFLFSLRDSVVGVCLHVTVLGDFS